TITTSVITSLSQSIASGSFTIDPTGQEYGCIYYNFPFTAKKNDQLAGTITSNITITFYVMSESQFQSWFGIGRCQLNNADLFSGGIKSYNVNYVVPNDGKYECVFLN